MNSYSILENLEINKDLENTILELEEKKALTDTLVDMIDKYESYDIENINNIELGKLVSQIDIDEESAGMITKADVYLFIKKVITYLAKAYKWVAEKISELVKRIMEMLSSNKGLADDNIKKLRSDYYSEALKKDATLKGISSIGNILLMDRQSKGKVLGSFMDHFEEWFDNMITMGDETVYGKSIDLSDYKAFNEKFDRIIPVDISGKNLRVRLVRDRYAKELITLKSSRSEKELVSYFKSKYADTFRSTVLNIFEDLSRVCDTFDSKVSSYSKLVDKMRKELNPKELPDINNDLGIPVVDMDELYKLKDNEKLNIIIRANKLNIDTMVSYISSGARVVQSLTTFMNSAVKQLEVRDN